MSDENFAEDESNFERRRFLKALGVGASVSGFGTIANAESDVTIEDSVALPDDETTRQLEIAQGTSHVTDVTNFVANGDLELRAENAIADRLVTNDQAFNAQNPVILAIPFRPTDGSEQAGFYWEILYDDDSGERIAAGGLATTVELVDGQHYLRIYGTDGEPSLVKEYEVDRGMSTASLECDICMWLASLLCDLVWWGAYEICMWICPWFDSDEDCRRGCSALADVVNAWVCFWNDDREICERAGFC